MGSEIQKVAGDLRALAKHANDKGREVDLAAREAGQLAEVAQAQGASGLSVARLVGQLQTAATKAGRAAHYIELVGANGEAFADRLAYAEGGQGHSVNPVVAGIVTAATAWTGLVADMQQSATTDVSGDVGTHDIERAASQHDHWEAANQMATPSSAAIHPADPRKKRS